MKSWTKEYWEEERERYHAVVEPWVRRRRDRRSRGGKHPVEDFIWEYYSLRDQLIKLLEDVVMPNPSFVLR